MKPAFGRSLVQRAAVTLALVAGSRPAFAEDPKDSLALEEVVVTATRQLEALDKTAAAITAVTSEALGPGGIQEIRDLAVSVPNLSVGDQFGVNRTFIRGIGMTSIGRGATAGVVNMITKKPTDQLDGYLRLAGGKVRPAIEVRLVDENDCEVPVGTVGEMIVRFPAVRADDRSGAAHRVPARPPRVLHDPALRAHPARAAEDALVEGAQDAVAHGRHYCGDLGPGESRYRRPA
jgi:acyl-CoA synthetase (AMP-forming)/AMP-acid ligase II